MTPLKLIACDVLVGLPRKPFALFHPDAADLDTEMKRLEISSAIVRHRQCIENFPHWGNDALLRDAAGRPAWIPAVSLTPDGVPDRYSVEAMMADFLSRGVRAGWISPREHMFSPRPWCSGKLFGLCTETRLPVIVDYRGITFDEIDEIMTAFPALRLIVTQVPRFGRHRSLYALLDRHPGLNLCLSSAYSVHEGLPDLVGQFGHARLVWGTSYPEAEGGASISLLTYAPISEAARAAIAHGNIERMLAEVKP